MEPAHEKLNWIRLPDPLTEEEVRIQITWTANARTELAIRRQAKLMGFATPTDYLLQALAAVIAGHEEEHNPYRRRGLPVQPLRRGRHDSAECLTIVDLSVDPWC